MLHRSIRELPDTIAALPEQMRSVSNRLLFVERASGHPVPPAAMYDWIETRFGDLEQVIHQTIVKVTNRWTLDTACYNPLRARRPQEDGTTDPGRQEQALETAIARSYGSHDIFHDPLTMTTADTFGRIQGKHCVSASNIAKYDGWHGVVIFNEFHPLRFQREQFHDYFDVALRWMASAQRADQHARYPLIAWNCLWKAGASITHGHMHVTLSRGMAYGQVERWRRAVVDYEQHHGSNWSEDLYQVHAAVGLGFQKTDQVYGYVSLTPVRDREVVLLTHRVPDFADLLDNPAAPAILAPLWDASYDVLRELIDGQGVRSFNVAVYFPPVGATAESWQGFPIYVRILDRGDPLARSVNIGAMEMFAGNIITVDPFAVAAALR